jgi:mRNA-degrading endonuclease toxin of MazEF toxin-antitoxin module
LRGEGFLPHSWDDQRDFKRGQVFFVDFESENHINGKPSRLLGGPHRAVVLFDSTFPRNTVVVLPISSLFDTNGIQRRLIGTDVLLKSNEYTQAGQTYANTIHHDSFIITNQIRSITRSRLQNQTGEILPKDMLKLDIQLIPTLGLQSTVQQMIEAAVDNKLQEIGFYESDSEEEEN